MTTDQKNKYEEAALTHTRITVYSSDFDAFMAGAEHAHPIAHSEGFDACLKMIEEERNILQNTGSLMWHKPDEQNKTLHIAECLSVTLKYINKLKKTRK